MEYNEQSWKDLLESLHFKEHANTLFSGKTLYDDKNVPVLTYDNDDIEFKLILFTFLSGVLYMRRHSNGID